MAHITDSDKDKKVVDLKAVDDPSDCVYKNSEEGMKDLVSFLKKRKKYHEERAQKALNKILEDFKRETGMDVIDFRVYFAVDVFNEMDFKNTSVWNEYDITKLVFVLGLDDD